MALIAVNGMRTMAASRISGVDDPVDEATALRLNRLRWSLALANIEDHAVAYRMRTEHHLPFIVRGRFGGCHQHRAVGTIDSLELAVAEMIASHEKYENERRLQR